MLALGAKIECRKIRAVVNRRAKSEQRENFIGRRKETLGSRFANEHSNRQEKSKDSPICTE